MTIKFKLNRKTVFGIRKEVVELRGGCDHVWMLKPEPDAEAKPLSNGCRLRARTGRVPRITSKKGNAQ